MKLIGRKRYISLLIVLTCFVSVMQPIAVNALGSTPPTVTQAQLTGSRPNGGTVLLDYDLNTDKGNSPMSYDSAYTSFTYDASGSYKLTRKSGSNSYFFSPTGSGVFDVKPNRNYLVSALVYCDFDRANSEVNIGIRVGSGTDASDSSGENPITLIDGFHGLPANTNGKWLRFETTVTTPPEAKKARFYGAWYGFTDANESFYIADMEVIELPAVTLTPLGVGEGLTFGGSSGMYNMKTEAPIVSSNSITVETNGAQYVFNKSNSTITVSQRIGNPRTLAVLQVNKSLSGLQVYGTPTDNEAILTTGENGLSFGVQMDGMLLISTHGDDATVTLTSKIGGMWNRLLCGNLISMDETGGFTVNPAMVSGTGRLAQCNVLNGVDFEVERGNTEFISDAQPGWSIEWTISSGERLAVTAFPPREYDWENSFSSNITNIEFSYDTSIWQERESESNIRYGVLWSACEGAYAMSYGKQYIPKDEGRFTEHISAAYEAGVEPMEYMSMYFWDGSLDEYIKEVKRHRDEYGITGVYSDGLPPIDWLKGYEGVRRLRELFPSGGIVFHTTGQTANGGAPLATPELFIPAIDAYATYTLRGESVEGTTKNWVYPRFVTSGYGTSNAFGLQKYDEWKINGATISTAEQQLLQLLYNGRARLDGTFSEGYKTILPKLQKQWQANGWSETYYEMGYLPYVRRLVRTEYEKLVNSGKITRYPVSSVVNETFATDSCWTQNGNTAVLEDGALKLSGGAFSNGDFLPCYGKTTISFKVKLSDASKAKLEIKNQKGKTAISLMQMGNKLYYLSRKGGYSQLCDRTDDYLSVRIVADPATGKYDLQVNGTYMLEGEAFSSKVTDFSAIEITNSAASANVYIDNLVITTGL